MKYKFILTIIVLINLQIKSQVNNGIYVFSHRPGTDNWESLNSIENKLSALQIPNAEISKLTTEGLLITCLNYPLYINMFAYDNLQIGIKQVINEFNGLQELFKRTDLNNAIITFYSKQDSNTLMFLNYQIDYSYWRLRSIYLEMLILQDEIINKMNPADINFLVSIAINNYSQKVLNPDNFCNLSPSLDIILMSKCLNRVRYSEYLDFVLQNLDFEKNIERISLPISSENTQLILLLSENFLKLNQ